MRRLPAVAVLLVASLAPAQDYLGYKMVSTAQQPFRVYVDSRSQTPAGLQYTLMQNAVERAWNTWNAVQCAYPKVQSLGPTGATVVNPSQSYDAYSVTPVWMLVADADAAQVFGNTSLVAAITLPRAYAGVLQTCDTYFNGPSFNWSLNPVTPAGSLDVETVALHESGHCLGLGHYGLFAEVVMEQVVEKGVTVRALSSLDTQMLCNRYPLSGQSASPCLSDGGCGQVDLKCLAQPVTNGLTFNLCSRGCTLGTNASCDTPLACQASNAFTSSGMNGACQLPGSVVTPVGRQCLSAAECGTSSGLCQTQTAASGGNFFWVDGYCTQPCVAGQASCPAGSVCSQLAVGPRCLQSCRVGLADCRVNYACAPLDPAGTSGVCVPRCYADQDCASPATVTCRTCDGLCVPRQNISGQIGDVCSTEASCGAGQLCSATGTSATKQCTQQCSRGCGICHSGSTCTPGARGELIPFLSQNVTGPFSPSSKVTSNIFSPFENHSV